MSSPDINYPAQPTYGEGMADAMKAQLEMLLGTGEFADIFSEAGFEGGDLADIIREVEAPLRQETAQTDTDVLRTTLLGTEKQMQVQQDPDTGKFGIAGAEVVTDADGNPQTAGGGRYQIVKTSSSKLGSDNRPGTRTGGGGTFYFVSEYPSYAIIDTETGGVTAEVKYDKSTIDKLYREKYGYDFNNNDTRSDYIQSVLDDAEAQALKDVSTEFRSMQETIDTGGEDAVAQEFTFTNPNIPTDASKAGQPGYDDKGNRLLEGGQNVAEQTITVREGDGLVDLLGDTREIVDYQTRQATKEDVAAGLATEVGENITETINTGRQAGFSDTGEFQGAAALAEEIQAGNLSRQRERDITDVERLSGRFKTIMDDYRPAVTSGLDDAKLLLTQQRENLTGLREATQADVDRDPTIKLGDMIQTGTGSDAISMPQKIGTRQATQDDVDLGLAANVGDVIKPYTLSGEAGLDQVAGEDTLRAMLLSEAKAGLGEGLTEREKARIGEAFKGQSTMMGRTFDQSSGIAEAEARMKEDNLRRLQNLGIAQSQLGQEAGLQAGDIARDMSADQFNVATQMDAETKNEQLRQQGLANYIAAVGNLAQIEDQYTLDPFAAILGRGASDTLGAGQGVVGQAGYGLQSGPQYLNPEAGLGYISQMAANNANIAAAQAASSGSTLGGLFQGLGSLGGGYLSGKYCWVAREVYGPFNPQWLEFRKWMFSESPNWFFNLYVKYGERFASWISDKPRIKTFIRKWMDSKIKEL